MKKQVSWIKSGVTGPNIYLNGYDYLVSHTYISTCLIYKKRLDDEAIKDAIEKILPKFPVLGGALKKTKDGLVVIDLNDQGIRFEVRQSNAKYQLYNNENNFTRNVRKYSYSKLRVVDVKAPLGVVTITHFKDQGSVISFSFPHSIIDSTGVYFVMGIMLQLQNQPLPNYTCERSEVDFGDADFSNETSYESLVEINAWDKIKIFSKIAYGMLANKTEHIVLDKAMLKKMSQVGKENSSEYKISKEDIIAATLWKCITKLRPKMKYPLMSYTVNLRFKTSLNKLFFGNASTGYLYHETRENLDKPVLEIAESIRKGLTEFGDEYGARESYFLDKYIDEGKIGKVMWKELIEAVNGRAFMWDPGHKFPFYMIDLGSGPPDWFGIPAFPLNGFAFTIINPDMQSIDLKVCLRKREIKPGVER